MKKTLLILAAATFAANLFAADTNTPAPSKIGALEATNFYNQQVIVTGKVVQVTIRPNITFINLDKRYPDSPFAFVIFHARSSFFGDVNVLKGKSIEVSGKIINYHDRPEMVLDSTNQLTVIGVTNLELFLKPKNFPAATNSTVPASSPPAAQSTNLPEIM